MLQSFHKLIDARPSAAFNSNLLHTDYCLQGLIVREQEVEQGGLKAEVCVARQTHKYPKYPPSLPPSLPPVGRPIASGIYEQHHSSHALSYHEAGGSVRLGITRTSRHPPPSSSSIFLNHRD